MDNEKVNNFSDETRALFIFENSCWLCGSNQNLELDHILGRVSNSPYNAFVICRICHTNKNSKIKANQLQITKYFLEIQKYKNNEEDLSFLEYAENYFSNYKKTARFK